MGSLTFVYILTCSSHGPHLKSFLIVSRIGRDVKPGFDATVRRVLFNRTKGARSIVVSGIAVATIIELFFDKGKIVWCGS